MRATSLAFSILVLLCFAVSYTSTKKCFEDLSIHSLETAVIESIQSLIKEDFPFTYDCLEILIKRNYLKAALELYDNYFVEKQIEVAPQLINSLKEVKKGADMMYNIVSTSKNQIQVIEPVIQWAQSRNHVFLNVKFAHRMDSPGCLGVKEEAVNITNNTLFLSAFGIQAHQPIRFQLNLTFAHNIAHDASYYNFEAVGTLFFNLSKTDATSGILWRKLLENDAQKIPIWWEMKGTYSKDMEDFVQLLEEEEEQKEKRELKKKKKKKEEL